MNKKDQFIKEFKPVIDNFLQLICDNKRHQKKKMSSAFPPLISNVTLL